MEKIERDLLELMATSDLQSLTSPYLPKTFHIGRSEQFNSHQGSLQDFIEIVDNTCLPKYLKCITNAYHLAILNDNLLSDLPKDQEGLSEIVRILTEGSIEIELAVDLVQRAKLYGIYEIPYGYKDLFTEIKTEGSTSESQSVRLYKYFLKYLSRGAKQAKDLISDSLKGYVYTNLIQSRSSIAASVLYGYFCSSFPWPAVALLGTQCAWVFSSILVTKIGEKLTKKLDKVQYEYKIQKMKNEIEGMISDLMERNENSRFLIEKCVDLNEENLRALAEHFNTVLSHKNTRVETQDQFDEDFFIAENVKISQEGEWTIIKPPEFELEQIDDWMILE